VSSCGFPPFYKEVQNTRFFQRETLTPFPFIGTVYFTATPAFCQVLQKRPVFFTLFLKKAYFLFMLHKFYDFFCAFQPFKIEIFVSFYFFREKSGRFS